MNSLKNDLVARAGSLLASRRFVFGLLLAILIVTVVWDVVSIQRIKAHEVEEATEEIDTELVEVAAAIGASVADAVGDARALAVALTPSTASVPAQTEGGPAVEEVAGNSFAALEPSFRAIAEQKGYQRIALVLPDAATAIDVRVNTDASGAGTPDHGAWWTGESMPEVTPGGDTPRSDFE